MASPIGSPVSPYISKKHPRDEETDYVLPPLRFPPISPNHDTVFFDANLNPISAHGPMQVFIEECKIYPIKFIDCGSYSAASQVVGVTLEGKHVVWQQAVRSCVPASISMIALDRGKTFLDQEIKWGVTSQDRKLRLIQQAGFEPIVHELKGTLRQKVKFLKQRGPGLLNIVHSVVGSHSVVLDAISPSEITFRDSYHGRMLTASLSSIGSMEEFIELK